MGPVASRPQFDEIPEDNDDIPEDRQDSTDSPARGFSVRRRTHQHVFQRNVSTTEEVLEEAPRYVNSFIVDMMDQDGVNVPQELRKNVGNVNKDVARFLMQIFHDLKNNQQLNDMINQMIVTKDTAFEAFISVASQIFSDGIINWGRIVTLLYFAYKLVARVMFEEVFGGGLQKTIIKWVIWFIGEKLVKWITKEGGWAACKSYFGSTSTQMVGVLVAGFLFVSLVFWMKTE